MAEYAGFTVTNISVTSYARFSCISGMKYKSFEDLPEHIAEKYKKMVNSTKPMYYESNPSYTEEELEKIVQDFINFRNTLFHGLPNQIAKLIAEEFEKCLQEEESWNENKTGEPILYGYEEGVFNGKGEKIMGWQEFLKKYPEETKPIVNISDKVMKKLPTMGLAKTK